jgi:hypothetical protein
MFVPPGTHAKRGSGPSPSLPRRPGSGHPREAWVARLRPHVVALGRPELVPETPVAEGDVASPSPSPEPAPAPASAARIRWAVLLARIYDVLPLLCPAGHRA